MMHALNAVWVVYALDLLAVAVVLVFGVTSMKKGFVRCLFGFVSTIIAFVVALLLMRSLIEWTNGLFGLQSLIEKWAVGVFEGVEGLNIDVSTEGLRASLEGKLPDFLINAVLESVGNSTLPQGTTVAMVVGGKLAQFAVTLISFFLLLLGGKMLLKLLSRVLSSVVENLPIIGKVNSLLGLAVGVLQGLLIVSAVIAVLSIIPSESIMQFLDECLFIGWLYNANLFHVIFGLFI